MDKYINLTQMWERTSGINRDGTFIYLRVNQPDMPGSLLTKDPWFANSSRLDADHWQVILNYALLGKDRGPHWKTASAIVRKSSLIAPEPVKDPMKWVAIKVASTEAVPATTPGPDEKLSRGP